MQISLSQVIQALDPRQPPEALFASIAVYAIMLLMIIAMMQQKDGSLRDTLMIAAVILFCLIDKITATSNLRDTVNLSGFTRGNPFGTFLIRVGMFALPIVEAGSTKSPKSRPFLIFAGLLGAAYLFARWWFEIKPA
jgi:hypothetical protein